MGPKPCGHPGAGYLALTVLVESGLVGRAARGCRRAVVRAAAAAAGGVGAGPAGGRGGGADAEAGAAGGEDVDVAAERAALQGAPRGQLESCF